MHIPFLVLLIILITGATYAQASEPVSSNKKPKWELGAGAIALNTPDYPGAKNNTTRIIPFPFFIYRGDVVRFDDEGRRIKLQGSQKWELGLSLGFNFPLKSDDTVARKGMPNLDAIIEVGPQYFYRFFAKKNKHQLNMGIALRPAFSSNLRDHLRYQGIVFEPRARYWRQLIGTTTSLFSSAKFTFGDSKINQYFYGVEPRYQTSTRPAFQAKSGLIKISASLGVAQKISDQLMMFVAANYSNQSLSHNKDSPLIEKQDNVGGILGFVWKFYQSEEMVNAKSLGGPL